MKRLFTALLRRIAGNRWPADAAVPQSPGMAATPVAPMVDCESVMRQLWDYLDGELTADRKTAIRSHLELCRRCHPQFRFEQAFLDAVAASAPAHSDPDRLRSKLLAALKDEGFGEA